MKYRKNRGQVVSLAMMLGGHFSTQCKVHAVLGEDAFRMLYFVEIGRR